MNKLIKGMFADYGVGKKILLLLGIFILLDIIGNVVGLGCDWLGDKFLSHTNSLRLTQFVASVIVFIGTPCVFFYLTAKPSCSFAEFFKLNKKNDTILYILAIVALFSLTPLVNYTAYINEQMTLPECLKEIEDALKKMEDLAKDLTLELLKSDSGLIFIVNLIVIAAAPAIGEEMMFRGALQKTLHKRFSPFWAIIITSIIFSAMHFQFYGFIPRFLLSVFLGMLYYFSGSIKLNMVAHFTNNAMAVIVYRICTVYNIPIEDTPTETLGKEDLFPVVIATVLFAGIMLAIYKIANNDKLIEQQTNEPETVTDTDNQEGSDSYSTEDVNDNNLVDMQDELSDDTDNQKDSKSESV